MIWSENIYLLSDPLGEPLKTEVFLFPFFVCFPSPSHPDPINVAFSWSLEFEDIKYWLPTVWRMSDCQTTKGGWRMSMTTDDTLIISVNLVTRVHIWFLHAKWTWSSCLWQSSREAIREYGQTLESSSPFSTHFPVLQLNFFYCFLYDIFISGMVYLKTFDNHLVIYKEPLR